MQGGSEFKPSLEGGREEDEEDRDNRGSEKCEIAINGRVGVGRNSLG